MRKQILKRKVEEIWKGRVQMRKKALILTAFLLVFATTAFAGNSDLVVAISYAPKILCMNYDYDGANYFILPNIMSKLVDFSADMKIIGDLAERWDVSSDGLKYNFYLAKGVRWHDGTPFSAEDVVWTVESIMENNGYGKAALAGVVSVVALDENTVVFTLEKPNSSFLASLARRYGFNILPKHKYDDGNDPRQHYCNWAPIGTGPFKFVEMSSGNYVVLEANEDYFKGAPKINSLIFKFYPDMGSAMAALEAGDINVMATSPPFTDAIKLMDNPAFEVGKRPTEIPVWLGFNLSRKPFDNIKVRKAFAHAIDRNEINKLVYQELLKPADTVYVSILRDFCNFDAKQPTYDPKQAEALLDEAGYLKDKNGTRFSCTYTAFKAAVWGAKEIGDVMRSQLAKVGIDLKVEYLDYAVFSEKILKRKDFDITWSGGPHGPDPQAFSEFVGTRGNRNAMGYSNEEVDNLFEKAKLTKNVEEQRSAYYRIQEIIANDLPRLALVEWSYLHPYDSSYVGFCWQQGSRELIPVDCYRLVEKEN